MDKSEFLRGNFDIFPSVRIQICAIPQLVLVPLNLILVEELFFFGQHTYYFWRCMLERYETSSESLFFFPEVRLCIITAVLAFCFFFIWGTFKKEPPTIRAQPCLVPRPLHSASQGLCVSGHVLRWFTSPTGCPRFNLVQRRVLSLAEKQLLSPLTLDFLKMFCIILYIHTLCQSYSQETRQQNKNNKLFFKSEALATFL